MSFSPITLLDGYKVDHRRQYPLGTKVVYSNWTPRKSRIKGIDKVVFFGLQYFIKKYLIQEFREKFFKQPLNTVVESYKRRINNYLGPNSIDYHHIEYLHSLGYLPLQIDAIDEGTRTKIGVPQLVIHNTDPDCFWLTNYIETLLSCSLWQACTSATIADKYKSEMLKYASISDSSGIGFVDWQAHDFSFRGMSSVETAMISGAAHLLSFKGTDTIPAIDFLEEYYDANSDLEIVGGSVPATEHSVMCLSSAVSSEIETFKRLITEVYPTGILSIVSDTWNLWQVVTEFLPALKDVIMSRDGKVVIRPDSSRTNPQDILCGTPKESRTWSYDNPKWNEAEEKGLVQCLDEIFGSTLTEEGYKKLDSHIGAIYGDSITVDRFIESSERLLNKGYASTNVVYGVGSFTYQYNTRDTFGYAVKATYGKVNGVDVPFSKDPLTDDGEKKSARGLLSVRTDESNQYILVDDLTEVDPLSELTTVFKNGYLVKNTSLREIRSRLDA